jgi:hypothetical protein
MHTYARPYHSPGFSIVLHARISQPFRGVGKSRAMRATGSGHPRMLRSARLAAHDDPRDAERENAICNRRFHDALIRVPTEA